MKGFGELFENSLIKHAHLPKISIIQFLIAIWGQDNLALLCSDGSICPVLNMFVWRHQARAFFITLFLNISLNPIISQIEIFAMSHFRTAGNETMEGEGG